MASPGERMTMDYPVQPTAQPSTSRTVRGKPGKVTPAEVAAMRAATRIQSADESSQGSAS